MENYKLDHSHVPFVNAYSLFSCWKNSLYFLFSQWNKMKLSQVDFCTHISWFLEVCKHSQTFYWWYRIPVRHTRNHTRMHPHQMKNNEDFFFRKRFNFIFYFLIIFVQNKHKTNSRWVEISTHFSLDIKRFYNFLWNLSSVFMSSFGLRGVLKSISCTFVWNLQPNIITVFRYYL